MKNTHFKLSLLAGAMFVATGLSAVEIKQQDNAIIFDELNTQNYLAKVRLPNGSLQSFKVTNGDFTLSAQMLGLDKLQNGLYKYELTPVFVAGTLSKDVRKLDNAEITAEYAKSYQDQNQSITGVFTIADNLLADKNLVDSPAVVANKSSGFPVDQDLPPSTRDQVIVDDLIVDGSICAGQDCVNGESFGFDTLRLKENNLRIKAQDTSNSASFPTVDWQLTFNDSSNGGANKFSIDSIDNGATPFTVEYGASSHSLYVDDGGRIGVGTSTPVVEMHIVDGDSPTLRLEQDGSSGFTPQTWDLASNEANFFIRDVTNGSQLPFRIQPGADSNSIYIENTNDVGIGTASPSSSLHVRRADGTANLTVEEANTDASFHTLLNLTNAGTGGIAYRMTTNGLSIDTNNTAGVYRVNFVDGDNQELQLDADGNLTIDGGITTGTTTYPDYVFKEDYKLLPLDDVKAFIKENGHLPNVPSGKEMIENGINLTDMHVKLMEKVEELTLYSLQQHEDINKLKAKIALLEK